MKAIRSARNTLRRLGIDVSRYPSISGEDAYLSLIMADMDIRHVIDVGANIGQFGLRARNSLGFQGRLDSYEPSSLAFDQLAESAAGDSNWHVHHVALGAASGTQTLHRYASSDLSSFSRPREDARSLWDVDWEASDETVDVRSLDDEQLPKLGPVLLKLDTQGYDWEVLDGAVVALERVCVIVIELSFIRLYESSRNAWDSMARLAEMGFGLATLTPVTRPAGEHRLLEADGVFVRPHPPSV